TSYLGAVLGLRHAQRHGADEGLFVDESGRYLEGTACALVAWQGGALAFAEHGVLPSVTAATFAADLGERRPLRRADLLRGAIMLGSLTRAAPLDSLDGEACAKPAAMLARIAAFNRELAAEAKPI